MDKQTTGTVIAATKQWWMKVNRKPVRMHALDGSCNSNTGKCEESYRNNN